MNESKPISFIRKLCPHKSGGEIVAIEENFRDVLELLSRIGRRQRSEQSPTGDSTQSAQDSTIRPEAAPPIA